MIKSLGQLDEVSAVQVEACMINKRDIIIVCNIVLQLQFHQMSIMQASQCQKGLQHIKAVRTLTIMKVIIRKAECELEAKKNTYDTAIIQYQSEFRTMKAMVQWPEIRDILLKMEKQTMNGPSIIQNLEYFRLISLKNKYGSYRNSKKSNSNYKLLELYQKQLPKLYSKIAKITLNNDFTYPLFKRQQNHEHSFTKMQALYLICSMALCLFPKQEYHSYQKQMNFSSSIDFHHIFRYQAYKTNAVVEYLKKQLSNSKNKEEKLTIQRLSVKSSLGDILKENRDKKMCKITIACDTASIENYYGDLKVDFANNYIGGGALSSGCVQEEIMFANHPQMFITQLMCQSMMPNEAIGLIGFQKYHKNEGYSHNTTYSGPETHQYQYDQQKRAKEYIIAIDALHFLKDSLQQFKVKHVDRQILKAYCGFKFEDDKLKRLVTGNWGCGAFGGNLRLKFVIQWIACSLTSKQMIYCPFGFSELINDPQLFLKIANLTIGDFYKIVIDSSHKIARQPLIEPDIYKRIKQQLWKPVRQL